MPRSALRFLVGVLISVAAACGEPMPTRPTQPAISASKGPASSAALTAQINGLINALFAPKDQGGIFKQFARIKSQLASGQTADAQASIVAFVQLLLAAQQGGGLQDPNGAQPPTTADALRDLVNLTAQLGGLPPPLPGTNPFADDGAIAVVGPSGGTVVSSTGFGGVGFPPGALPADVIVVVSRLPDPVTPGAGPLPTTLTQYPLFYEFSTVPAVTQFAVPVTVAICQLEVGDPFGPATQQVADRLQLAHPDPANPGTVELLERVNVGFIDCDGVTLAANELGRRSLAARTLHAIGRFFRPSVAYAVHGGLGGKTTSFSPFAAVDPGLLVVGVCGTPMPNVSQTYPTVDIALANVAPGGVIRICPQTISVPATYLVDKPVTIEADDPQNPPQFLVNGATTPVAFTVNPVLRGAVTFRSLSFTHTSFAVAIDLGLGQGPGFQGSWWQVVVENSQFTLPAGLGRAVRVFQTSVSNPKAIIRNNQISGGGFGIVTLTGSPTGTIEILSNSFSGGQVLLQNEANARVEGNTFTGGCFACIGLDNVGSGLVQNNTLTIPAGSGSFFGISVRRGGFASVIGNSIVGTGGGGLPSNPVSYAFAGAAVSVGELLANLVGATTVNVSGNTITNAVAGIRVLGGSATVTGADNVISNVLAGLRLDNTSTTPSSLTIGSSDFTSYFTPVQFSWPPATPSTLVATCNWWGSAAGPQNITPGTPASMLSPFATAPVANGAGGQCNGSLAAWLGVSAGTSFTCGLRSDGAGFCWGANNLGQLGDGTQNSQLTPVAVAGGHTFVSGGVGDNSACGLTAAGALYCWGSNDSGQLGAGLPTGTGQFSSTPVLVSGGHSFTYLSVGLRHTCALATTGVTYCWGGNQQGELGNGTIGGTSNIPVAVSNSASLGLQRVSAGFLFSCSLTASGALYCWGFTARFGNGPASGQSPTPVLAGNGGTFLRANAGSLYACGVGPSGGGLCWGSNVVGEAGIGSTSTPLVPTAVAGGLVFQMIDANANNTILAHTCGVTQLNLAYCWGSNRMEQLGATGASTCTFNVLTFNCSLAPIPVSGGIQFSLIAVGNEHTCAVGLDQAIYCWGLNAAGQLGDNTTTNRAAPVRVASP